MAGRIAMSALGLSTYVQDSASVDVLFIGGPSDGVLETMSLPLREYFAVNYLREAEQRLMLRPFDPDLDYAQVCHHRHSYKLEKWRKGGELVDWHFYVHETMDMLDAVDHLLREYAAYKKIEKREPYLKNKMEKARPFRDRHWEDQK